MRRVHQLERVEVHLAVLRGRLLDHLDAGRTPLPWVLDEVLVHWDADRRASLYPLLARAAKDRQVFLLTCHPVLADEAVEALGALRISLASPVKGEPGSAKSEAFGVENDA